MKTEDPVAPAPAPEPAPWLTREVKILSAMNFVSAVGFGIQSPAIPVLALQLGVGSAMVGGIIAAFSFGRVTGNIPAARMADRYGTRLPIVLGLVLIGLASILAGLSQAGWHLTVLRGISGLGSAMYSVAAMVLLMRASSESHRGRVIAVYMGTFYVGATAGPAIGAAMAGLSPRVPFFVYGITALIPAVFVAIMLRGSVHNKLPAADPKNAQAITSRLGWRDALRIPHYRAAMLSNFSIGWASYGVRVSLLPLFLLEIVRADASWIGWALAVGALAQACMLPVAGGITDLLGRKPSIVTGQALMILSYLMVLLSPTLWAYVGCFVVLSLGTALCATGGTAMAADVAKGRPDSGALLGNHAMAADVGSVVGPVTAGWLAANGSYHLAFGVTVVILVAGVVSAWRLPQGAG